MPDFDVKRLTSAWNAHAVDRILELYADDAQVKALPDPEPFVGHRGVRLNAREILEALPDMNCDVMWSVQKDDKVCMLVRITGRHAGPLTVAEGQVVPATDRKIDIHLGAFLELDAEGKIWRETRIPDAAGLLMQVGVLGVEAPAQKPGSASTSPRRAP